MLIYCTNHTAYLIPINTIYCTSGCDQPAILDSDQPTLRQTGAEDRCL